MDQGVINASYADCWLGVADVSGNPPGPGIQAPPEYVADDGNAAGPPTGTVDFRIKMK